MQRENTERDPLLGLRGWRELKICGYTVPRGFVIATLVVTFLIIIVITIYFATRGSSQTGCEINPLLPSAPLLFISGTSNFSYPRHGENVIKNERKALIDFACPGGSVVVNGTDLGMVVTGSCVSNQQFEVQGRKYEWKQLSCSKPVKATIKKTKKGCIGGEDIQIGFDLGNGTFATLESVCFNTEQEIAIYSQFELTSSIVPPRNKSNQTFIQDDVYNISMDNVYKDQQTTINTLLHLDLNSTNYVNNTKGSNKRLSRGHLAARADFLYIAQQDATYRYINIAPQWHTLNAFNWEKVERDTRNYANKNKVDLQIWTGIFNISTLPDINNTQTELYLYNANKEKLIPVPAFFWKVVYNPINEKGIALVSFNNPYKNETEVKNEIFCKDVANGINWLTWNKTSLIEGYSFACTLTDFQKAVNVAPKLKDSGLLL